MTSYPESKKQLKYEIDQNPQDLSKWINYIKFLEYEVIFKIK